MGGRNLCCCSGVPKAMSTGATIFNPKGIRRGAPASADSSSKMYCCTAFQPVPPNSLGQLTPPQPALVQRALPREIVVAAQFASRPAPCRGRRREDARAKTSRTSSRKARSSAVNSRFMSRPAASASASVDLTIASPIRVAGQAGASRHVAYLRGRFDRVTRGGGRGPPLRRERPEQLLECARAPRV